jgi:hypothetical protein
MLLMALYMKPAQATRLMSGLDVRRLLLTAFDGRYTVNQRDRGVALSRGLVFHLHDSPPRFR